MNQLAKLFSFVENSSLVSLEEKVMSFFKTLPKLPLNVVDFIVNIGPYLVLIGGIFSVLALLTLFSIGSFLYYVASPFVGIRSFSFYFMIIGSVISGIMMLAAFTDLRNKKLLGWRLVFWAGNISIIFNLISLNLLGTIISALISWYILSQIKERYV